MGYDAVALSQTDISYGDAYLSQQRAIATFPFLTSTENDFTQPFVIKNIGQHTLLSSLMKEFGDKICCGFR